MENARAKLEAMTVRQWFWLTLAVLVATLVLFEYTDLDLDLQRHFYDAQARSWLVDGNQPVLRFLFYNGIKWLLVGVGAAVVLAWGAGFRSPRLRPWRRVCFFMILAMGLVPLTVAASKKFTHVFCPSDLALFNGDHPYVRLFEPLPEDIEKCGCCFPAGHASGGFSLLALYFLFPDRRRRGRGLAVGLGLGWVMGIYQMFKGAHFLSHTIVTMEVAWLLILFFYAMLYRGWQTPLAEAVCIREERREGVSGGQEVAGR